MGRKKIQANLLTCVTATEAAYITRVTQYCIKSICRSCLGQSYTSDCIRTWIWKSQVQSFVDIKQDCSRELQRTSVQFWPAILNCKLDPRSQHGLCSCALSRAHEKFDHPAWPSRFEQFFLGQAPVFCGTKWQSHYGGRGARFPYKLPHLLCMQFFVELNNSGNKSVSSQRVRMANCLVPLHWQINKLTSVFHASVLLLIMHFVITLSLLIRDLKASQNLLLAYSCRFMSINFVSSQSVQLYYL